MGFKAKNNSNTTGAQWKKKYESKSEEGRKTWARRHYDEIWPTFTTLTDRTAMDMGLSNDNYQALLAALKYATDTLRNLFQGKADAESVPWDKLAKMWNASIIVKRYFKTSRNKKLIQKCATDLRGVKVVYGYKLKFKF